MRHLTIHSTHHLGASPDRILFSMTRHPDRIARVEGLAP